MNVASLAAQVVETSVNVITNSPSQDYTHPDDHNLPTYDTLTIQYLQVGAKYFQLLRPKLGCDLFSSDWILDWG